MKTATQEKPIMAHYSIKMEQSEGERIKSLASAKKRSSHFIMKEAIRRYLDTEETEQKQVALAVEALDRYEKTGLHVTLDEMKTWLQAKKINRNTPMPACHI